MSSPAPQSTPSGAVLDRIDAALARFLDAQRAVLGSAGPDLTPIADAARDLVFSGGKRMRPLFAYWGWRCVHAPGADHEDALITAAASLELLHVAALVHDDLIDDSSTRRGQPAAHTRFAALAAAGRWPSAPAPFGAAAAILLGDLLLTWSAAMLDGAGLAHAPARVARGLYDSMCAEMVAGQYLDILEQARGGHSVQAALRVARFKSSKYTVERPVQFGAAAGGAPTQVLASLSDFGLPLGEAFQLRDDVLGVYGNPAITGKPAGDDLREGKRTVLVALAFQGADQAQRVTLADNLGRPDLGVDGIAALRDVIIATGALDEVEELIEQRRTQAVSALADAVIRPEARQALTALADAATRRTT